MFSPLVQLAIRDRRVLFWRLQVLGWGFMIIMTAMVARIGDIGGWDAFVVGMYRTVLGFVLTSFLVRPLLRLSRRHHLSLPVAISLCLPGCGLLAWGDRLLTLRLAEALAVTENHFAQQYIIVSLVLRWMLYAFWCGLYLFIHYWLDSQEGQLRLARLETEMRTAELQRLRAQVNPHFLYNAFNSILAETDNPQAVASLTQGVAEYLRFSLRQPEGGQSLGEELNALDHYLRVEKIRFEERLEFSFTSDALAPRCRVPGALVQPLVENAIKYGQRTSPRPLQLSIETKVKDQQLTIVVANTGQWIEPDPAREGGIGLANLRQRLALLFGARAGIALAHDDGWVRVVLHLPAEVGV
ncbi:MAG: histidine kinase [Verrucomicrobia bacterium]|nr:histidine kinase [Verrucomicrobiota bacterium]